METQHPYHSIECMHRYAKQWLSQNYASSQSWTVLVHMLHNTERELLSSGCPEQLWFQLLPSLRKRKDFIKISMLLLRFCSSATNFNYDCCMLQYFGTMNEEGRLDRERGSGEEWEERVLIWLFSLDLQRCHRQLPVSIHFGFQVYILQLR